MLHIESNSRVSILWLINTHRDIQSYPVYNVHTNSTREEKSEPSHYTGKVRAHASVLACLTLYSPPCLCAKHVQIHRRRVHVHLHSLLSRAFFAMRICTYTYQFHLCIIQQTHAHCASSDKPHPSGMTILLTSPMGYAQG